MSAPVRLFVIELLLVSTDVCEGEKKTSPHVTGFAHRRVLLIHYSDCKTPFPTSPVLISSSVPFPLTTSHVPLLVPCHACWIFDGALAGGAGHAAAQQRGKRTAAFPLWCLLWECRSVTWGNAGDTSQYESTLKSLVSLARTGHYFWFFILPTPRALLWSDFRFAYRYCIFLLFPSLPGDTVYTYKHESQANDQ